ncbi:hypothetical protein [Glutamicibacter nicotianae]|uniref:hypothetical protein n=1 Tax=Glutamicibacter nicotianae TaxID=37929 RepID=UPI00167F25AE|nr:hypothetical protein [Glutamicibacter nicotianae]
MIGIDLELHECTILLAGSRSGSKNTAKRFETEGATVLAAEEPFEAIQLLEQASLLVICDADPLRFTSLVQAACIPVIRLPHESGSIRCSRRAGAWIRPCAGSGPRRAECLDRLARATCRSSPRTSSRGTPGTTSVIYVLDEPSAGCTRPMCSR